MADKKKVAEKPLTDSQYNTSIKPGDSITVGEVIFTLVARDGNWSRVQVICPRNLKIKKTRSLGESQEMREEG